MNEYNQRQYKKMLECIEAYQTNLLKLPQCINNLKALIACLESPDEGLRGNLESKWGVLEEVYAVSLDQGGEIPAEHLSLIQQALGAMKVMIEQALEDE